ncbi:MAG: glycosyltransferase family 4 protein [Pseudomonadota bacterium]
MEPTELNPRDRRPRLLHVFPSFGYGGQQARFASIANGLGARYAWHVVSLSEDFSAQALLNDASRFTFYGLNIGDSAVALLQNRAKFKALFKKTDPDLLCTYNWGAIEAAAAWPVTRAHARIHFEDGFGPYENITRQHRRRVWARRLILSKGKTVVPSRALETVAHERWRIPPSALQHIPNGVHFDRFQQTRTARQSGVVVGTIGALRPEKNFMRLISAFSSVTSAADARLVIVGDGPVRDQLRRLAIDRNLADRIQFIGATPTPENLYKDFDVFALSSDTEQAPLTLLEAMASGLPIVATDVGDIATIVSAENKRFVMPLGDDGLYASALSQLIESPNLRAALGAANRKRARDEFDAKKMIARHHALYQSVLERHAN